MQYYQIRIKKHKKNKWSDILWKTNKQTTLLDKINNKPNEFLIALDDVKEPAFIYGAGSWGIYVGNYLGKRGIKYTYIVDEEYYEETPAIITAENSCGSTMKISDAFNNISQKANVIVAHYGYNPKRLDRFNDKINSIISDYDSGIGQFYADSEIMTYDWVLEHISELQKVYDMLGDELSKETFTAFINQRISTEMGLVGKIMSHDVQYFEKELIKPRENEVFVDCGAYNGDTAYDFTQFLKKCGIKSYDSIISFEPDEKNCKMLRARNIPNHICISEGVSDKKETVYFMQNRLAGVIVESSSYSIETDTIDNVLDGKKADMIKMDIEGSELAALKGAANTIMKYKPDLAICAYHKKSDLYELPLYINELVPEYKIYLRVYDDITRELVIYAIA